MQLVSNFAFSLKLTAQLPSLLEAVEAVPQDKVWSKVEWSEWIWISMRATGGARQAAV